jgi:hypothetical protein
MSKLIDIDFGSTKTASQYNADMDALLTGRASINGATFKTALEKLPAPEPVLSRPSLEREGKVASKIRTADEMVNGVIFAVPPVEKKAEEKPQVVAPSTPKTAEAKSNPSPVKLASGSDELIEHLISSAEGNPDLQAKYKFASQFEEGREILKASYALGTSAAELEIAQGAE